MIYLIRHAEADGNITRRIHGHYNGVLTPRGHKQAESLINRFKDIHLDAIYSSDLNRTFQTATPLAQSKNLEIITSEQLREVHMGDWEDRSWAELPKFYPEEFNIWTTEIWNCQIPNGETLDFSGERVLNKLYELAQKDKTIAVFSHGLVIRTVLCKLHGKSLKHLDEMGWCDNCGIAKLVLDDNGKLNVEYQNNTEHMPYELTTEAYHKSMYRDDDPSLYNLYFINASKTDHRERMLDYAKITHESAYGNLDTFCEETFINDTLKIMDMDEKAVSFGIKNDEICTFVRIDLLNNSEKDSAYVGTFCIDEQYRGTTMAAQIVGQAMSVARRHNKKYLKALVSATNVRAQKFYEKFGFQKSGELLNSHGNHFIMAKKLVR